ncbi:unnamed protein product [Withania somnifera]
MLRLLSEAVMSGNTKSAEQGLISAVLPLLKLLSVAIFGLVLAYKKTQVVPKETFKLLSKLFFALVLPCLIFTHLGQSITIYNFEYWLFIPVNVLLSTILGLVLGVLVVIICRPPPGFSRFTIIMTAFGNTGNLPLAIVAVIFVYTLVYHKMEPLMEYYEFVDERKEDEQQQQPQQDDEDKETEHLKTPLVARIFRSLTNLSISNAPDVGNDIEDGVDNELESVRCLAAPKVIKKMITVAEQKPVKHILQPPTVPRVKTLEILAGAMVPSVMLILGGVLAEEPNVSKFGLRTMIGISVARLFVLPLLGIGVVTLVNKMNILVEGDHMYRFVLLLQYTTPSAILLGPIASLRGYAVIEASALIFRQHLLALFSLSLYIVVYFKLFSFV